MEFDLASLIYEYKLKLVEEYRNRYPLETKDFSDKEVMLMNPMMNVDDLLICEQIINDLEREKKQYEEDIVYCQSLIDDANVSYQEKLDCRQDIIHDINKIKKINVKMDLIYEKMGEQKCSR